MSHSSLHLICFAMKLMAHLYIGNIYMQFHVHKEWAYEIRVTLNDIHDIEW